MSLIIYNIFYVNVIVPYRRCSLENSVDYQILRRPNTLARRSPCTKDTPCLPAKSIQLISKSAQTGNAAELFLRTVRRNETSSCSDPPSASAIVGLQLSTTQKSLLSHRALGVTSPRLGLRIVRGATG